MKYKPDWAKRKYARTNEQTDGRTNRRTDGHTDHYMTPAEWDLCYYICSYFYTYFHVITATICNLLYFLNKKNILKYIKNISVPVFHMREIFSYCNPDVIAKVNIVNAYGNFFFVTLR